MKPIKSIEKIKIKIDIFLIRILLIKIISKYYLRIE